MSVARRVGRAFAWTLAALPLAAAPQEGPPAPEAESPAGTASRAPEAFAPRDWLVLAPVDGRGRRPFRPDAVVRDHLLRPDAPPPTAGARVEGERGAAEWTARAADADGALGGGPIGWAYAAVERDARGVWMAELSGANTLWVNGEPFQGDLYRYGFGGVPIALREGVNHLYVTGARGGFRMRFVAPPAERFFAPWDRTLPDVAGPFAVLDVNASEEWTDEGLPPLWVEKRARSTGDHADERGVVRGFGASFSVAPEPPDAKHVASFVSEVDGSAQRYGVAPPTGEDLAGAGLVLSLHGASVPVRNQLGAHSRHEDLWIFVPTNRRPFGFDWQDWGRRDAYEVLERGIERSGVSRDRLFLVGHSMGGHGVWHLAANDPDTWAAIQPSAAWCSFDTYGGRPDGELSAIWRDADGASRTLDLIDNLAPIPTFVVHGTADETVPISEARDMVAALRAAGGAPETYFHEGGGHWWDGDASAGADCLEWIEAFAAFAAARIEAPRWNEREAWSWTTVDPRLDATHRWVTAAQALEPGRPIRVDGSRTWIGVARDLPVVELETENARVIGLRLGVQPATPGALLALDGDAFEITDDEEHWFERRDGRWIERGAPDPAVEKTPARGGGFKRAFDRRFLAVVGTAGDDATDAALLARARHDAQQWWYRGNGFFDVATDLAANAAGIDPARNRVLYGNADANAAWDASLPEDCPVRVEDGRVTIGDRVWEGDDLACVFTYPLAGSDEAVVGAFGSTGPAGARIAATFGTFVSGAGFPDLVLLDASVLTEGDGGVLAAGWFEHDWTWSGGRIERGGTPRTDTAEDDE